MITGLQIRAARAALLWSATDLAERANTTRNTIYRLEQVDGIPASKTQTLLEIKKVFEDAGIEFTGDPTTNPGLRMTRMR